MKRKIVSITCNVLGTICIVLGAIFIVLSILPIFFTSYNFSEGACYSLFECTPGEFSSRTFDFYDETGNLRKQSRVNGKEELVLYLTQKQITAWRELDNMQYMTISSDFKTITTYLNAQTSYEFWEEHSELFWHVLMKAQIIQLLDGIPHDDIFVTLIVIDIETGETLVNDKYYLE